MFRYRLHLEDGTEIGEAAYTQTIKPGEIIWAAGAQQFRVVAVVPMQEDSEVYAGMLMVAAA